MRFVFRADGSSAIGYGHLSRTVALSSAARRSGAEVVFVTAARNPGAEAFVRRAGGELHVIGETPGTIEDARATAAIAGSGAFVVADGYAFRNPWFREVGGDRRFVVYIDDLARERLECDVVVNPNVSGGAARYDLPPRAKLLAGAEYVIVDDRFVAARERKAFSSGPLKNMLVTFGGSDPPGASLLAIEALASVPTRFDVRVIVGAANPRAADIRAAIAGSRSHSFEVRVGVDDMAEEMRWAECVIAASGVTASEISCVGVPGVVAPIVDNQRPNAAELARTGMFDVVALEDGPAPMSSAIARLVEEPARRLAQFDAQRRIVDGRGKERLMERLLARRARSLD